MMLGELVAMPLIKVQTSASAPDKAVADSLLKDLSACLSKNLGKSESYIMTAFEPDATMTFAGTNDPACYVEIKSVGSMSSSQTKSMSEAVCQKISQALNIDQNRIYIEFADAKGAMWGWNGRTFG